MTKQQLEQWKQESIEQAMVRFTVERYCQLIQIARAAGEVH